MVAPSVEEFLAERPRLFGVAYRMLGEASEAEDVVQDAYLRWTAVEHAEIFSASAWLTRVVTNLCLNRLTSARARRETYVGPWVPEPVLTGGGVLGPLETAEQREAVSLALLMLLERLSPSERAVFVLREAFGYSHRQIAEFLGISEASSRQLYGRGRQRLADARRRFEPDVAHWRRLVERFLAAARGGDVAALRELLAVEATSTPDGGGVVGAGRRTVVGRDRVARYLAGVVGRLAPPDVQLYLCEVNAAPAVLGFAGGQLRGVIVLEIADEQIRSLHLVANPTKLAYLERQFRELSHLAVPLGL